MARKPQEPWSGWVERLHKDTGLSKEDRELRIQLAPLYGLNDYIPHDRFPNPMQGAAILATEREVLLGGEAGSGKSEGALMKALTLVTVEGFMGTFFRENERQLLAAGGIVWTATRWLAGTDAQWNQEKREFYFPKYNSTLGFGFMAMPGDEENYIGFPRQFFDWEELTRYKFRFDQTDGEIWNPYQFLLRSMRKPLGMPVPIQTFASTNPGGASERFVMDYFLPPPPKGVRQDIPDSRSYLIWQAPDAQAKFGGRVYIHGVRAENVGLDQESYDQSEALADPITQAQQFKGIWGVATHGGMFHTERIRVVPFPPSATIRTDWGWDLANTAGGSGPGTALALFSRIDPAIAHHLWGTEFAGLQYIVNMVIFFRFSFGLRDEVCDKAVLVTGSGVNVYHEQEGAGAGSQVAQMITDRLLNKLPRRIPAFAVKPLTSKEQRAQAFAAAVENRQVGIVSDMHTMSDPVWAFLRSYGIEMRWNQDYLAELRSFPNGLTRDRTDASTVVFNEQVHLLPVGPPVAGEPRPRMEGLRFGNEPVRAGQM